MKLILTSEQVAAVEPHLRPGVALRFRAAVAELLVVRRRHPSPVNESLYKSSAALPFTFVGAAFPSTYEAFNYFECAAWLIIAIIFPLWFRACPAGKRSIIVRASLTFVVFAVSDYLEAPTHGRLPPWLWAWKLFCAAYLLKCRYDYIGRERFRWLDRTNVLALACFLAVLLAMFLQYYFRDLLSDSE